MLLVLGGLLSGLITVGTAGITRRTRRRQKQALRGRPALPTASRAPLWAFCLQFMELALKFLIGAAISGALQLHGFVNGLPAAGTVPREKTAPAAPRRVEETVSGVPYAGGPAWPSGAPPAVTALEPASLPALHPRAPVQTPSAPMFIRRQACAGESLPQCWRPS